MWKIVHLMQLILIDALFPFSAYINAFETEFLKCQFLDDAAKGDFVFLDIFVGSRLVCGTKCTEHLDQCFSYAWNANTKRCLLYNKRCTSTTITTDTETYWEEYAVRECVIDIENGIFPVTKTLVPGTTLTGSCNSGYKALTGQIEVTCHVGYTTTYSDTCRLVLTNIAVDKPSLQSSTFDGYGADLAVDGIRNTDFLQGSCSHTDFSDRRPWWRVDLQSQYYVLSIQILNRGMDMQGVDQSARLKDVTVTVGLTSSSINTFCAFFAGPGTLSQLVVLQCPPYTLGRYVKISIMTEFLTLCEVDVIAVNV